MKMIGKGGIRRLETGRKNSSWMICIMKGVAARMPICKLLAPSAKANAARKPLVVILLKPRETIPSRVNQRSPVVNSWSEIVGLGLNNLSGFTVIRLITALGKI